MDTKVINESFSTKKKAYLSEKMIGLINDLIAAELNAQQLYKSMSTWATYAGYTGLAKLMDGHTGDENSHMNKLYKYMLDRQVNPITPAVKSQPTTYKDLKDVLEKSLAHEELIENTYKNAVKVALAEADHTSYTFFQWFLSEQVEEIDLFSGWLDRLAIIGYDKLGMYFLDNEILESLED